MVFAKCTARSRCSAHVLSWARPQAVGLQAHLWVAEAPPSWQPQPPAGDCRGSGAPVLGAWELPATLFVLGCLGGAATLCQLQHAPAAAGSPSVKGRNCSRDLCFPCQR